MTPDDRDPVDVLAEDFADRLRRGERPSVASYAAAYPEHAAQLRDLLPAVAQMEQLKRFRKVAPAAETPATPLPDRLGDFRIVRELGRGGMGVVFEAVQESLGRRVALKILSSHAQLAADRRERFVREAKAAARLHHTNIVTVFGVGEHDGLPYYVMQLIPGRGLHEVVAGWKYGTRADTAAGGVAAAGSTEVIAGRGAARQRAAPPPVDAPTDSDPADALRYGDWRFVAGIGIQVADALQYAHEQGILHRDVKPANLLLDGRGQVWVADFGLAKVVDQHTMTATGHVLGTLQYLAPECLHGTADARGDVYGLGATLYELLTLDPPFTADAPARLMRQIAEDDPPAPRALNPAVPCDLETIVLKAIAREPGRRYASAAALAADLRAFLDDRPIQARRETWAGRGRRWCRRNPAVAALSATTAAALVAAAAAGWVGYARTRTALAAEATALAGETTRRREAEEASAKLEANLRLSLAAFEAVFEAAGGADPRVGGGPRPGMGPPPGGPGGVPGGPPATDAEDKAAVLEAVLAFYDKFAEQNATNPRLRLEAAKAHRRVGDVHLWLDRQDKAGATFRRAAGLLADLDDGDPDVRFERMLVLAHAPPGAAGGEVEGNLARAADLGRTFTTGPRRWAVGTVFLRLGVAREAGGNPTGAAEAYREAVNRLDPGRPADRPPPPVVLERIAARRKLAALAAAGGDQAEARRGLENARAEGRMLLGSGPHGRQAREVVAETCEQLAGVLEEMDDPPAARRARDEAFQLKTGGPKDGPFGKGKDGPSPKDGPPPPKGPKDGPPPKGPRDGPPLKD